MCRGNAQNTSRTKTRCARERIRRRHVATVPCHFVPFSENNASPCLSGSIAKRIARMFSNGVNLQWHDQCGQCVSSEINRPREHVSKTIGGGKRVEGCIIAIRGIYKIHFREMWPWSYPRGGTERSNDARQTIRKLQFGCRMHPKHRKRSKIQTPETKATNNSEGACGVVL